MSEKLPLTAEQRKALATLSASSSDIFALMVKIALVAAQLKTVGQPVPVKQPVSIHGREFVLEGTLTRTK